MPWLLLSKSSAGALEIVYVAGDGGCVTPQGVVVQQLDNRLVVAVLAHTDQTLSACADSLRLGRSHITLNTAQAALPLLHAAVDHAWSGANYFSAIS